MTQSFQQRADRLYHRLLVKIAKDALHKPIVITEGYLEPLLAETLGEGEPDFDRLRQSLQSRLLRELGTEEEIVYSDGAWISIDPQLCTCAPEQGDCHDACAVEAIVIDEKTGQRRIDPERCIDCGLCISACQSQAIAAKSQCMDLVTLIRERQQGVSVHAAVAPAFVGQLEEGVTVNQFKTALLKLGFTDVWEVAMAADVITLQEADEYIERTKAGEEFMITSCCCPAFVKLVEKHRPRIAHLVSHSVSPMVALGRLLKARQPQAKVVFIGPCLAKRAEARQPDLADAVDLVLTFKELWDILAAAGIDFADCREEQVGQLHDASRDGRIYAHTGGVSEAILRAICEREPDLEVVTTKGNGLKQCMEILKAVESGHIDANFMEGMGCPGGCVGGPGTLVPVEIAAQRVKVHSNTADFTTASSNSRAREMLTRYLRDVHLSSRKEADVTGVPSS